MQALSDVELQHLSSNVQSNFPPLISQGIQSLFLQLTSLATTLGLRAPSAGQTPSYSGYFIVANFALSYVALAPRHLKQLYGIDNNVSPRQDLDKYGDEAIKAGKITRRQFDMVKRTEAAQANSIENMPIFVGALLFAHQAGLSNATINRSALVYTLTRILYGIVYIRGETLAVSVVRTLCWWTGNITCLRLFWIGTKALNGSL